MNFNSEDLRSFLAEVESGYKLQRISQAVSVADEIPALCSEITLPTVFENLQGFADWRLTDGLIRDRLHQAIALKCQPHEVIARYAQLTIRGPGETGVVKDSPVKEVVWTGKDADLTRLPVPIPAEGIDVPHLGLKADDFATPVISGAIAVTKNPATGVHNCFFTMAKVHSAQRTHCYVFSPHTWENIRLYQARGERAPMALVIGCHPIYELAAVYTGPHPGFSEIQLAAAMLGEPVALINCETVDLQVPACAEVIIEGHIDPQVGRYVHTSAHTDTRAPFISNEPFFDITAITMRSDPIYRHIQPTRFTDHQAICEFITAPMLLNILRGKGLDVHDVAVPLRSSLNCAIIQMSANAKEEVREALLNGMALPFFPRLTIAVDADVDIHNMDDVIYALSVRVDPAVDIMTVDGVRSFNLEPISLPIPGMEDSMLRSGTRYGIDATKPPLSQPDKRIYFERLKARGEGKVFLRDYLTKL
jgi:2,5-furandicarboxylate decarboxylase 1